jgi:hypothetical protein
MLGLVVHGLLLLISPKIIGVERGGAKTAAGLYWYYCKQFHFIFPQLPLNPAMLPMRVRASDLHGDVELIQELSEGST